MSSLATCRFLCPILTINGAVVYMPRDVMILMGKIHFEGHWKGRALKIETFQAKRVPFWPEKALPPSPFVQDKLESTPI